MHLTLRLVSCGLGILTLLGTTACGLQGSGIATEEKRVVGAFKALRSTGAGAVVLTVDATASSDVQLTVMGDDNIVPELDTRVEGDTLVIQPRDGLDFDPAVPLKIMAIVPALERLHTSGSIDVTASGLNASSLEVVASGSSDITLSGFAARASILSSGSADIQARELRVTELILQSSETSDLEVCAEASLRGKASGSADVRYFCSPAEVQMEISDAADVNAGK